MQLFFKKLYDESAATAGGAGGSDTFSGFENVMGSSVEDSILGNTSANTVDGGAGNDTIDGGLGDDSLIGGAGDDLLTYAGVTGAVTVDMSAATAGGAGGSDTFSGFENVIGSSVEDSIIGDSANNSIAAGDGADTVTGGLVS